MFPYVLCWIQAHSVLKFHHRSIYTKNCHNFDIFWYPYALEIGVGAVFFFCGLSEKIFKIFSDFENLKKYSTKKIKKSVLKILKKYSTENVFGNPEKWSKFPYFDAKTSKFSRLRRATSKTMWFIVYFIVKITQIV